MTKKPIISDQACQALSSHVCAILVCMIFDLQARGHDSVLMKDVPSERTLESPRTEGFGSGSPPSPRF